MPTPASDSVGLGWALRTRIRKTLPGDANTPGPWPSILRMAEPFWSIPPSALRFSLQWFERFWFWWFWSSGEAGSQVEPNPSCQCRLNQSSALHHCYQDHLLPDYCQSLLSNCTGVLATVPGKLVNLCEIDQSIFVHSHGRKWGLAFPYRELINNSYTLSLGICPASYYTHKRRQDFFGEH